MPKIKLFAALSLLLLAYVQSVQADNDNEQLKQEAISIVKKFGGTLKPQLGKALKTKGPAHAVKVCSVQAPEIADQLRKETGWDIKRVSLKARNNSTAIPNDWEEKILKQFDLRQSKGESAEKMAYSEVVDGEFRFMKAQGTEALCLTCHGENISPDIEAALKEKYPHDKALGYSAGQIRGAFSLAKKL